VSASTYLCFCCPHTHWSSQLSNLHCLTGEPFQAPKVGLTIAIGAVLAWVLKKFPGVQDSELTVEVQLGSLGSWAREGHRGVHWVVLPTKATMNLLCQTMDRVYHTLGPQMAHPSALEKGVASLNVMHMHASIAPHLPNEPLGGPTIMEEEISMGGTVIGKLNVTN